MNFKKMCSHPLLGANSLQFLRLVSRQGILFNFTNLFRILYIFCAASATTILAGLETRFCRPGIEKYHLKEDPVFIIGHWRSGTTFLHYLMSKDPQFGYLKNNQAFMPYNMFFARNLIQWLVRIHLFRKRPMDDITMSVNCAQEEEIALSNMGAGAYLGWYFPKRLRYFFSRYLFFEDWTQAETEAYKAQYKKFILKTALANGGKPLILKNPANTTRITMLLEMFPQAKFIYLHRDPYEVFCSTVRLHKRMIQQFAFQKIEEKTIEKMVMDFYPKVLHRYEASKARIPSGHLLEVDYTDLTQSPVNTLRKIYQNFGLSGFETVRPAFEKYLAAHSGYQPAVYQIKPEIRRRFDLYRQASTTKYRAPYLSVD